QVPTPHFPCASLISSILCEPSLDSIRQFVVDMSKARQYLRLEKQRRDKQEHHHVCENSFSVSLSDVPRMRWGGFATFLLQSSSSFALFRGKDPKKKEPERLTNDVKEGSNKALPRGVGPSPRSSPRPSPRSPPPVLSKHCARMFVVNGILQHLQHYDLSYDFPCLNVRRGIE
ncbi:hypothetical protein BS17DRAFT_836408, partial [Gyrodon lividus]